MSISFFSPKTQFENLGDVLINRELVKLISENNPLILDQTRSPKEFLQGMDLSNGNIELFKGNFIVFLFRLIKTRLVKREQCYYFLSPGGYVGELSSVEYFKQILNNLLLRFLSLIGIRLCLIGVSYERLGKRYLKILKQRSNLLDCHLVRDSITKKYVEEKGISITGQGPDLAFNIFTEHRTNSERKQQIVISFRVDQNERQFELVKNTLFNLGTDFWDGKKVIFYSQVDRDALGMLKLKEEFSKKFEMLETEVFKANTLEECETFFEKPSIVLSNRLHVLLIAASCQGQIVPCYADGNNQKLIGLFSDLFESKIACIDLADTDNVPLKIREHISKSYNLNVHKLTVELKSIFKILFKQYKL